MNMQPFPRYYTHRWGVSAGLALLLILFLALAAHCDVPQGRSVALDRLSDGPRLRWLGVSGGQYGIEGRSSLNSGGWSALDTVAGADGEQTYALPSDLSPSRFFRVLFPQPAVEAGEPAYAGAGGGTVYITGQFFYAGDTVSVGGIPLTDVTFLSPTLLRATLPPLPNGLYDIAVLSGHSGGVLATLPAAIEVSPPLERTLQEPPEWPPAGPTPTYKKEFKGHVTLLKAFDDDAPGAAARGRGGKTGHVTILKAFDDQEPAGAERGGGKTGHVTILKAFDDEDPALSLSHSYLEKKINRWLTAGQSSARGGKTGHVTLMKAFDDDPPEGAASREFRGHVTLMKAFDDQEPSAGLRGIDKKDIRRGMVYCATPHLRLHSGEVQVQVCDLALSGCGLDFAWVRTYRSRTGTNTTQGASWSHAYDVSIQPLGGDILIHDGTGRRDTYRLQPDGTYACPGLFREGGFTNGAFRLTFADTGFWAFNPLDASPASGKLARIEDRNGNAITLSYDTAGRLAQITDTLSRAHTVAYDTAGRVASVTDSTGRAVTYTYDTNGDLVSVTSPPVTGTPNGNDFPDGKTVSYAYTSGQSDPRANHLLLTVTDALGQTAAQCAYDLAQASPTFGRCASLRYGSEPPACVTYLPQTPSPDNRFAAMRCVVNDPAGNVTESFFDLRNRCVTQREFTGRAAPGLPVTDVDNRPAGKLRPEDPDLYETQIRWNNDSLCTRVTLPSGLTGTFIHGGDAYTTWRMRKRPELLYQAWDAKASGGADTDGDGAPDLFLVEQRNTYDERFGSDPMISNLRTRVNELETILRNLGLLARFDGDNTPIIRGSALGGLNGDLAGRYKPRGWNGQVKGVRFDGGDDDCDGFATSVTDPRGTVTTHTYDAKGNRVHSQATVSLLYPPEHPSTADRTYDTFGHLTSITSAPDAAGRRRVTTYGWQLGHLHDCVIDAAPGGLGITLTFERDERGNVTRAVDPDGHDTLYAYNALDQLVTCSSPPMGDGAGPRVTSTLTYDANDNVTRIDTDNRRDTGDLVADNPAWSSHFAYDALDRCVAAVTEVEAATTVTNALEYDANGRLAARLSPAAAAGLQPAGRCDYAYDERGLLFRVTRAPGTADALVTEFAYDPDCRPASLTVGGAPALTVAHDGLGRAAACTDTLGTAVRWCFNAAGDLTQLRAFGRYTDSSGSDSENALLAETRWVRDGLGNAVLVKRSHLDPATGLPVGDGEQTTRYDYAPNGQLTGITNDLGHGWSFGYDTACRLTAVAQPGSTRHCTCTPGYRIASVTETDTSDLGGPTQTFTTGFAYDPCGRLLAAWDNVGNTNRWAYDSRDLVTRAADARGNETRYRYDGRARRTASISYVGPCDADSGGVDRGITISTTHVEYDVNGRAVAVTDSNTNTTTYAYDARDRLVHVAYPDGTSRHLVWSPRSNLAQEEDAAGTVVTYSYDPLNRLIRKDVACGAGVEPTTTFEAFAYDGLSRLVAASNDLSRTTYVYDSLGFTTGVIQDGLATFYSVDAVGNWRTCSCPSGYSVHRAIAPNNLVSSVTLEAGGSLTELANFAYDGAGRLAQIARTNGVTTHVLWNGMQSPPNPADDRGWKQVAAVSHVRGAFDVVDERVFGYDADQNKTLRALTGAYGMTDGTLTNTWSYDALGRLAKSGRKMLSMLDYRVEISHDGKGNRLSVTNSGTAEVYAYDSTQPVPGDFQMDQVTAAGSTAYAYDEAGRRASRLSAAGPSFYHYDYAGRLVQVDGVGGGGFVEPLVAFDYDALGRRVAKRANPASTDPVTTVYVRGHTEECDDNNTDPGDGIVEVRKSGGGSSSVSVRLGGASAASYAATGRMLAPPLAMLDAGSGDVVFTHSDDLGNVLALTDVAGNVVERVDYDDFGAPTFRAPDGTSLVDTLGMPVTESPAGNPFLFRGLQWDGASGLYLDGDAARYVDPQLGQYLSRDGRLYCWGGHDRAFAENSPWTLKKEEGGRHTPFHNRRSGGSGWTSITMPSIYINTKTTALTRSVLKTYFETGDKPTQGEFGSLIDSIFILEASKRIGSAGNN